MFIPRFYHTGKEHVKWGMIAFALVRKCVKWKIRSWSSTESLGSVPVGIILIPVNPRHEWIISGILESHSYKGLWHWPRVLSSWPLEHQGGGFESHSVHGYLLCAVRCRQRPWGGSATRPRRPNKCVKQACRSQRLQWATWTWGDFWAVAEGGSHSWGKSKSPTFTNFKLNLNIYSSFLYYFTKAHATVNFI
jgi:hypothetical protein